ncbi:hypothetical protein MrNuV_ORF077 [Macrobrachium rosenbergii nudivirus]|nr:hypothetical protein MrNuV_ORF077 [Macrobrachium rosenbergii nudivirus]
MSTELTIENITKCIPNLTDAFKKYLYLQYDKIPKYEVAERNFQVNGDPTREELYKMVKVNTKKPQVVEVRKFFDNPRVEVTPKNIKIKLKGGKNTLHTINTGLSFKVNEPYILMINVSDEFKPVVNMNPLFIDSTVLMAPCLYIDSNLENDTEITLDIYLFSMALDKFYFKNERNKNAVVKNCPKLSQVIKFEELRETTTENGKMYRTGDANANWLLSNNTALFIFNRKRYNKLMSLDLFGGYVLNGTAKLFNIQDLLMDQLSFVVVVGLYDATTLKLMDEPNVGNVLNGGYNGWLCGYDLNYETAVAAFKDNQKIHKHLKTLRSVLDRIKVEYTEDELLENFNAKITKRLIVNQLSFMNKNTTMKDILEKEKAYTSDKFVNFKEKLEKANESIKNLLANEQSNNKRKLEKANEPENKKQKH